MFDNYETGISCVDYVEIAVYKKDGEKIKLIINPVGQFNPGGCLAFVSVKQEKALALKTSEELFDMILSRVYFENLEAAFEIDDYSLRNILEYTSKLEEDDNNSWYLRYFKTLNEKVNKFKEELLSIKELEEYEKVEIIQNHEAAGEECDFVDYVCCPEGAEEEELREFFESNLSPESEIDNIMECFEDGYYYGNGYEAEEKYTIDYQNKTFVKTTTITNVR